MDSEAKMNEPEGLDAPETGFVITELAALPDRALLDETALAAVLHCTKRTVQNLVARYELPPPLPLAGRKVWIAGRLLAWLEDRADRAGAKALKDAERLGA